jgi:hypothetical protein
MVSDILKERSVYRLQGSSLTFEDETLICGTFFGGYGQMVNHVCLW